MDSDRKSTVSSFYGRSSYDALNAAPPHEPYRDHPSSPQLSSHSQSQYRGAPQNPFEGPAARPRAESTSSFYAANANAAAQGYGQEQGGAGMVPPRPPYASAGYNRNSFFNAGRTEPLKGGIDERDAEDNLPLGASRPSSRVMSGYGPPPGAATGQAPGGSRGGGAGGGTDSEPNTPAWDVYADFNNAGPRYSSAFGIGKHEPEYQPLTSPSEHDHPSIRSGPTTASNPAGSGAGSGSVKQAVTYNEHGDPVELVTVPALGPEWQRSELKDMTRAGKREKANDRRRDTWKAWNRGETGLCGRWFTKRALAVFVFIVCCIIGIVLAITVPRVPSVSPLSTFLSQQSGSWNDSIPTAFSRAPANFSFPAYAGLQISTSANVIPLTFSSLSVQVWDGTTNMQIGTGAYGHLTIPAKAFYQLQLPLNISYVAGNDTDPTWVDWYSACKNPALYPSGQSRPGVNVLLYIDMAIRGLPGTYKATAQVADAGCPFELPTSAA